MILLNSELNLLCWLFQLKKKDCIRFLYYRCKLNVSLWTLFLQKTKIVHFLCFQASLLPSWQLDLTLRLCFFAQCCFFFAFQVYCFGNLFVFYAISCCVFVLIFPLRGALLHHPLPLGFFCCLYILVPLTYFGLQWT